MAKILVVEDDLRLSKLICDWLKMEHHLVETTADGTEAAVHLKMHDYDLIILDWNLPNISGIEILQQYRAKGGSSPVLMLTGKDTIDDKEHGLNSGADDYLTKPFDGRELSARIKALLRRPAAVLGNSLQFGGVTIDRGNYRVLKNEEEVHLVPKEFALLEFMMRHPNRVFAPEELLNKVWPTDSTATSDALTTCIKRLRKKLDQPGRTSLISTVHGVGYKIMETHAKTDAKADSLEN